MSASDHKHNLHHPTIADETLPVAAGPLMRLHPETTSSSWSTSVNGDWATGSNWTTGSAPDGSTDATISVNKAAYTVTIDSGVQAHSVTLSAANATLDVASTLSLGGSLAVSAGTLILDSGGSISGGTLSSTGGTLLFGGGTLDQDTIRGALNVNSDSSQGSSTLTMTGGTTFTDKSGSGFGTLNLTSSYYYYQSRVSVYGALTGLGFINLGGSSQGYDYVDLYGTRTLSSGTISSTGASYAILSLVDDHGTGSTLTLGSTETLTVGDYSTTINIGSTANTLVNQGTMKVSASSLDVGGSTGTFVNSGLVTALNGASLTISASNWSNTGTFGVASGSILYLAGSFTTAGLGTINRSGGTVTINGTLSNAGATLSIGGTTSLGQLSLSSGTISGGTIADFGSGLTGSGTLSGISYRGQLVLGSSSNLYLSGGTTLSTLAGTGAGSVAITGNSSTLYVTDALAGLGALNLSGTSDSAVFYDSRTLDNLSVKLAGSDTLQIAANVESTPNLTLGSAFTLSATNTNNYVYGSGGTLTNSGSLSVNGGALDVGSNFASFSNQGTLRASGGGTLTIDAMNWTNAGSISETNSALNLAGSFSAATLNSIQRSGGTLSLVGTISNAGATLATGSGTALGALTFAGATLTGGVLTDAGGGVLFAPSTSSTWSGVTYRGPSLTLGNYYSMLTLSGGTTLTAANGTSPIGITLSNTQDYVTLNDSITGIGTLATSGSSDGVTINAGIMGIISIVETGNSNNIQVNASQVFDNLAFTLGGASYLSDAANTSLTFGPTSTLTVVDVGAIYDYGAFIQQGLVSIGSGALGIYGAATGTFTNQGTVSLASGGTFTIQNTAWSNTGTIVDAGGTLSLGGTYTQASLGTIQRSGGGLVTLAGTLNNAGQTLTLDTGSTLGSVVLSGTIQGGIVHDDGGAVSFAGGTLSGLTYQGNIALSSAGPLTLANTTVQGSIDLGGAAPLYVSGNDSFTGLSGTGTGSIHAVNSYIYTTADTTLDNATISIGNDGGGTSLWAQGGSLTLGTHLTLQQADKYVTVYSYYQSITNLGTILAATAGGTFSIGVGYGFNFQNSGSIIVTNGDSMVLVNGTYLSNLTTNTLVGGSIEIDANSTLSTNSQPGGTFTTLAGVLTLSGANSQFLTYDSNTGSIDIAIDTTLRTIASAGTLSLLAGRSFSHAGFVDNGVLNLGGGTLTSATLTVGGSGLVTGFGALAGSVSDSGVVTAHGGTLAVTGSVTGTGGLHIDRGATLDLAGSSAETITFTGSGATLRLEQPTAATGPLAGFGVGDTLALGTLVATSATLSATSLVIGLSGGGSLAETLVNPGSIGRIDISTDGHSMTADRLAQPSTATPATIAFGNHHVGDTVSTTLSVSNLAAADGFSESLDVGLTASAGLTTSGTITRLAPGATDSTDLHLGLNTSAAGSITGTGTLTENSDGGPGLPPLALGTQMVTATGAVYAYAAGSQANGGTVTLANTHVGQTVYGRVSLTNTAAANAYSELLDATVGSASTGFSARGSVSLLAAGATNSASLVVGANVATSGTYTGNATLGLTSDGSTLDGLGTTSLANQAVTIVGTAYNYATPSIANASIKLGVIHAGVSSSQALVISNTAAPGAYSEALDAGWSGSSGGLVTGGTLTGLAAGGTDSSSLLVSVTTSATGTFSATGTLGLISDGTGLDGLGTTGLASRTVTVSATVDNFAAAAFQDGTGPAITGTGTSYAIDLGNTAQGGSALTLSLGALNTATGLADLLSGTISTTGGTGFSNAGFGTFSGLGAGQGELGQTVTLSAHTAGVFTETVLLSGTGSNASGYSGALVTETLTITGTIYSPGSGGGTYTLSAGANTVVGQAGGDLFIASAASLNSRDRITGGAGANVLQLTGPGTFDLGAPRTLANIQTVMATEGQAAGKKGTDTRQTIYLRDGLTQTLDVANGTPAAGNTAAEAITIYGSNATDAINLGSGSDAVILDVGTDTITLGGATNSVMAGGGTALVEATAAVANAAVVGSAQGSTTLEITSAGTVSLAAADKYLTVRLDAAGTKLTLSKLGFITADGSAGNQTLVAAGKSQTLIGGAGDTLTGFTGGSDSFVGSSAALSGDIVGNWTTGDLLDVTDLDPTTLKALSYTAGSTNGTLTVADATHSTAIVFSSKTLGVGNFVVMGSDGHGGSLIGWHS